MSFRQILPLVLVVLIAAMAVVFVSGREGQFAEAAARLPDQVLHHAQTLRSDMKGGVVILQDFVAEEGESGEEPVVLKADVPAGGEAAGAASQATGAVAEDRATQPPVDDTGRGAGSDSGSSDAGSDAGPDAGRDADG